ncbi:MAG TPA: Lrp/AsnC ligand binding domain-containing protein [Rhodospirillales bacterium]|jgi:DNA-binding Lrp family transcriptional regulator|nr:Lrp/AsnC ligand binding domain-containing protein [Rhodospirillales bacterium]MDP7425621.1 Lrp/AsnC ligand binding domain-containing protein [Rhodospirillales bacterium]MDP7625199.1 Lrp/AsnC ligand binding domain-containing protein [Rhodospirillales bacterium]HJO86510.1 Lrp/AsnC ligand binding domain-containing protein [Rhodospirillales bacterium]
MQTVFVQVKCELGHVYKVAEEAIESVDKISEIHSTSGQFDLLIKCYLDDTDDIGHFISDEIQTLPGVKDTYTLITFKAFS